MATKRKNIKFVFIIYWTLLIYTMAALIWWFIELNDQNTKISRVEIEEISTSDVAYKYKYDAIIKEKSKNTAQFIWEGGTFLLLIIAGAIFIYRGFVKELKLATDQRNFMMAITHELKTPIAIAKLNLETIQKHKLAEAQQQKLLSNTLIETNRLDILCNNLLVSSQIDSNGYEVLLERQNFSKIVNDCANGYITNHPNRVILKTIAQNVVLRGDVLLLQIAVNNLLENAVKYSAKEKPITVSLSQENNSAVLKIIDEGIGIAEEERLSLFKKFYRSGNEATRRAKGTGLGLHLTDRICKVHQGDIFIEKNPKGGSIFNLILKTEV
jgi:two-component system, OmpR family, sensor histidine kinase CiaH